MTVADCLYEPPSVRLFSSTFMGREMANSAVRHQVCDPRRFLARFSPPQSIVDLEFDDACGFNDQYAEPWVQAFAEISRWRVHPSHL